MIFHVQDQAHRFLRQGLRTGVWIPADGLFVSEFCALIDKSSLTGESEPVMVSGENPFLLSGSKVQDGSCKMLMAARGNPMDLDRRWSFRNIRILRYCSYHCCCCTWRIVFCCYFKPWQTYQILSFFFWEKENIKLLIDFKNIFVHCYNWRALLYQLLLI